MNNETNATTFVRDPNKYSFRLPVFSSGQTWAYKATVIMGSDGKRSKVMKGIFHGPGGFIPLKIFRKTLEDANKATDGRGYYRSEQLQLDAVRNTSESEGVRTTTYKIVATMTYPVKGADECSKSATSTETLANEHIREILDYFKEAEMMLLHHCPGYTPMSDEQLSVTDTD